MIIIKDNGKGMSEKELQNTMNIGSKDPRNKRGERELGDLAWGSKQSLLAR